MTTNPPGVARTDYERIASRYDDDRQLSQIHTDDVLMRLLGGGAPEVRMLDVGCGTGRFLAIQLGHFKDRGLTGVGVDLSSAMLASAGAKMPRARLVRARAEGLPFHPAAFEYDRDDAISVPPVVLSFPAGAPVEVAV